MRKVYCDSGGYKRELREFEARGLIELCTYVYENKNKKVVGRVPPSNPTWDEGDSTWDESEGTWDDYNGSELWPQILKLIGPHNEVDAKHIDSAYLGACHAFITSDKGDISSCAREILALTGVRVFHVSQDWDEFVTYIQEVV